MDLATQLVLQRAINRLDSDCATARDRIARGRTMRDVKMAADVYPQSILRGLPQVRTTVRQLKAIAEKRMNTLLDAQLQKLKKCQSPEEMKRERRVLVLNDWCFLRGEYSTVYRRAEYESGQILYQCRPPEFDDDDNPTEEAEHPAP
jgi:hypothetical protein